MTVQTPAGLWVIPPQQAMWVPPGNALPVAPRPAAVKAGADAEAPAGRFGAVRRVNRIYTLDAAGDPVLVEVKTGIADTRFTEQVGEGLKDGDAVIVREIGNDKGGSAGGPNFRMRLF